MPDSLSRSFFDLRLDLIGGRCVIYEDAELIAFNEEATCLLGAIAVEVKRLDGKVANVTTDDYPNDAEQASRDLFHLGVLLHETKPKHPTRPRKTSKTLAKSALHLSEPDTRDIAVALVRMSFRMG